MFVMDQRYIELTGRLWQKYIASGKEFKASDLIREGLREEVAYSWARSKASGISPSSLVDTKADPADFDRILAKNERLITIALPYLNNILEKVAGSNYVVQLCDANGCVLKCLFDTNLVQSLAKIISTNREGYHVSEQVMGTASTGVALVNDAPIQIVGSEHYQERNHVFCCSSCPIHDKSDGIVGILTVMCLKESYHLHTLGMVCAVVDGIEKEMKLRYAFDKASLSNEILSTTINSMTGGIGLIDAGQRIMACNTAFVDILRLDSNSIVGQNIYSLFDTDSIRKSRLNFSEDIPITEIMLINNVSRRLNLVVEAKTIKDTDGKVSATFVSFDTQKNVHEFATTIIGSKASYTVDSIIGTTREMKEIKKNILEISKSDSSVLITGESGTGKAEPVKNSSHNRSTMQVHVQANHLFRSTAVQFLKISSQASCSVRNTGPSLEQPKAEHSANSNWQTMARCSSMKSVKCLQNFKSTF